jgi:cation diffusion facilitator CzcD-associated flavoprotein CzcO
VDVFPTQDQIARYLDRYATYFDLYPRIRLRSHLLKIHRNEDQSKWELTIRVLSGEETNPDEKIITEPFDKVAFATGLNDIPFIPTVQGIEKFRGQVLHSNVYKKYDIGFFLGLIFTHVES